MHHAWHICVAQVASCRESYGDAEGVLTHLKNVDTPLKAVLDGPADVLRLEVRGTLRHA